MNKRLDYLDCLRGMVMLMVVFCHICGNFCLKTTDSFWLDRIFSILMLPGFFFVSGWFTRFNLLGGVIVKRFQLMLLPTLFMFLLYVFFYWGNMSQLGYCALGEYKWGYWFTFALFLMNCLHGMIFWVLNRLGIQSDKVYVAALFFMAIMLVLLKDWDWTQNQALLARWFSLRLLAMYFPFYVMGMCCRKWESLFHRVLNNEYVTAGLMVAFTAGLIYQKGGFYFGLLMGVLGVLLLYRLVYFYQNVFSEQTKVGKQLCIIGRNTLPIYLLHYFFFLGLKLPEVGAALDVHSQWGVLTLVAFALTLLIVYASLGIAKVLAISKPIRLLLLGVK